MHRRCGWCVGFLLLGTTAVVGADAPKPAEPPSNLVEEYWESVQLDGVKVGTVHTTVQAEDGDGRGGVTPPLLRARSRWT